MTRLAGVAAIFVAAAMLFGMQRTTPYYSDIISVLPVRGAQDARVDLQDFSLLGEKAYLARELRVEGSLETKSYDTQGVWLVVQVSAEAAKRALSVSFSEWRSQTGLTYAVTKRLTQIAELGNSRLEPGIPAPLPLAFELPLDEVPGGTLIVGRTLSTTLTQQAWIAMDVPTDDVRPMLTLRRTDIDQPWEVAP